EKNILLVNPWIYDFTAFDFWMKPLGLLYVASLLKSHKSFRLSFIDCLDRNHPLLPVKLKTKQDGRGPFWKEEVAKPAVLGAVPRKFSRYGIPVSLFCHELHHIPRPDLVLISGTMTYWYPGVQLVIELIRRKYGRIPVALGGIYPTLMAGHARREIDADFILEGSAEKTLPLLLEEVFGTTACCEVLCSLSHGMLWPAFDLLRDRTVLPLLTSRGCPYKCAFCASRLLFQGFDQFPPHAVAALIEHVYKEYKTRHLAFYDDALLLNKADHIVPVLERIIVQKMPVAFHSPNGLHVREIDARIASLFRRANFQSLYLSQESFDEKILVDACFKVSPCDLETAVGHLTHAGYRASDLNVYLMTGLPGQNADSVHESILRVQELGARPRLAYFSPVPGTTTWHSLSAKGVLDKNMDPLLHNKLVFSYLLGDISPEELSRLKALADNLPF
ncbi:MAG: radical SAM protein, partial [Candidatus Aminicenantes bacterium]|nr:radical SAM protein [Candidatus Aminicenantes bacterium]